MKTRGENGDGKRSFSKDALLNVARQRAQRISNDAYKKIFMTVPDAICVSGLEDKLFHEVNPAFVAMFGYTEDELIGKCSLDFDMWVDLRDREKIMDELHRTGEINNYEGRFRTKLGTIGFGKITARIIENNSIMQMISVIHDITDQKLREVALRESESQLRELNAVITRLSITDPLTELYNRRHFYSEIEKEIERYKRHEYKNPPSIMVADIDRFKSVNDLYGHAAGDQVLKRFAEVLRFCTRATDSAYRYGGEEFVVILPDTREEDAIHVAEKIRNKFKEERFLFACDESQKRTVSIGVAQYRIGESYDDLFNRADGRLYYAKENGRDSVYCAH